MKRFPWFGWIVWALCGWTSVWAQVPTESATTSQTALTPSPLAGESEREKTNSSSAAERETPEEEFSNDPRYVSPYSAVARSVAVPGWGQARIGQPIQGVAFLALTGGLMTGFAMLHRDFRTLYDNEYLPAVQQHGVKSKLAEDLYREANQKYKMSRFLLFTAVGVWGYSLIDAYVDATIRNAEIQAGDTLRKSEEIRRLEIGLETGRPALRFNRSF